MGSHNFKFILIFSIVFYGSMGRALVLPPNTYPLYVEDPVLPSHPEEPEGFGCFGACGPSCNCIGKEAGVATTCESGQRCDWTTITCKTHSFCRWHDDCYRSCDYQFPGKVNDGSAKRTLCYRSCDASCIDGDAPEAAGGWTKTKSPGRPPEALGIGMCLNRLAGNSDVPYDGVMVFAGGPKCVIDPNCK